MPTSVNLYKPRPERPLELVAQIPVTDDAVQ